MVRGLESLRRPARECDDVNCPFHGSLSVRGRTLEEAQAIHHAFKRLMHGEELSEEEAEELGELEVLSGVRQYPIRIKCALLGWATLDDGIEEYEKSHG
jgi:NifU-like protein involved in Fe-S cluster formation